MKRRMTALAALAAALTLAAAIPAYAGNWKQNDTGWWYQNDNHLYPTGTWQWIDGNQDGISECYYFDDNGYLLTDTTTPDGYSVNGNGAWVENGIIKQRLEEKSAGPAQSMTLKRIYEDASRKTSAMDSMEANAGVGVFMEADGESLNMSVNMDIKYKDLNTSNLKFMGTVKADLTGFEEDMAMSVFYTDGYYYMQMDDEKYKMPMNLDEMVAAIKQSTDLYSTDVSYTKNWRLSLDENGNRVISYDLDYEMFLSEMDSFYRSMGMDLSDSDMKFEDVSGSVIITPDGYCKDNTMRMRIVVPDQDVNVAVTFTIDIHYLNPGQPVDFVLPSTDGYEDMGW